MIEVENIFKKHKVLIYIFIGIAILNAIIAAIVQRGMYLDGALHFNIMLDNLSQGKYAIFDDTEGRARLFVSLINQFFINFAYYILSFKNKYVLSCVYSLSLFLLPLAALYWNYKLSERTKRYDIALWSLFFYSFLIIQSSIYAIVESNLASIVYFVLLNYLVAKIDYNKKDVVIIFFLTLFLFRSTEMVLFLGVVLFFASLFYAKQEENPYNKKVKYFIGMGSLFASIYMLYWFLTTPISTDALRFLGEATNYFPVFFHLDVILTLVGLILAMRTLFIKNEFTKRQITIISVVLGLILNYMLQNPDIFLNPMMEGHLRTIHFWAVPLIFAWISIADYFDKRPSNTYFSNLLVIICIVGIAQTIWQINNSYWYNKEFEYLKFKLAHSKTVLVNPDENSDIFDYSKYRRFRWPYSNFNDSLFISKDYKIKSVLIQSKSPNGYYDWLFKIDDDAIMVPTRVLSIKNRFWDLTDVANKLETKDPKTVTSNKAK